MEPLQESIVGDTRKGLLLLMSAVALVLLIVCVNIANLSLVRATKTRRERAVRVALGAGRHHLIRASLAESMIIGASGTVLGLALAIWIKDLVIRFGPVQLPRLQEATVDFHAVAFAIGLCVLTVILFGLLPGFVMSGFSPLESMQAATRSHTEGPRGSRLRAALVSTEVAITMPLLIGAGLLLASFERVLNVPRGLQMDNVVSDHLVLPRSLPSSNPRTENFLFPPCARRSVFATGRTARSLFRCVSATRPTSRRASQPGGQRKSSI